MTEEKTGPKTVEDEIRDDRTLAERIHDWFHNDSPSWFISLMLHVCVLLILGIAFGGTIYRKLTGSGTTFEAVKAEQPGEEEIERFDIGDAPLDPTELNTDSLMSKDPAGQAAQEALHYDDSPMFEEQGGGAVTGTDDGAGGLGFNIKAAGLGPVLHGGGGADLGKGEGAGFGKGGAGEGFGGRGQGNREALLGRFGGTKLTERAVAGALNWLARHQQSNGSWSVNRFQNRCKDGTCTGSGSSDSEMGGTALGLLPFLAAGQTHVQKGPYQKTISNAVQYITKNQKSNGELDSTQQPMYAHGLATIALCEAYGMSRDPALARAAQSAVNYIQSAQNDQGGWRYFPRTTDSDTSVFGWQMMALKSAMMAGLSIDPAKLQLGRRWLKTVSEGEHNPAAVGQFGYREKAPPTPCMSAVALLILQYTGSDRDDPLMVGGIKYLMANMPAIRDRNTYYWYYATQVLHNVTGPDWDAWNRHMRRILVETQNKTGCATGSWDPSKPDTDMWGQQGGRLMMTSLSALTLEVYYRYLPLYRVDSEGRPDTKKPGEADAKKPAEKDAKKPAEPDAKKPADADAKKETDAAMGATKKDGAKE